MNITAVLLILLFIFLIIEIKFKPRLDIVTSSTKITLILWYSIKSKGESVHLREYFSIFKINKNN